MFVLKNFSGGIRIMLPLMCIKKSPVLVARKMSAICLFPPWRGGKVCCVGKTELWTGRVSQAGESQIFHT